MRYLTEDGCGQNSCNFRLSCAVYPAYLIICVDTSVTLFKAIGCCVRHVFHLLLLLLLLLLFLFSSFFSFQRWKTTHKKEELYPSKLSGLISR